MSLRKGHLTKYLKEVRMPAIEILLTHLCSIREQQEQRPRGELYLGYLRKSRKPGFAGTGSERGILRGKI